ncbi:hypothetical protein C2E23DRAFT_857287 [Lenzites betulinus]|nr:hypothetical protein C2E23DRAFT_857287 [Lenzites betulinus]
MSRTHDIKLDLIDEQVHLPSPEEIIQRCREANAVNRVNNMRGVALVDEATSGTPYAWVKYGWSVTIAEARTQQYVAQAVKSVVGAPVRIPSVYCFFQWKDRGYIVMEFIDGDICSHADVGLVASAVQFLITIKGPTDQPGPIDGGLICHDFFIDRQSSVAYSSVDLLEGHVNGILKHVGRPHRVNLIPEFQTHGLRLCLSDMNRANFMKDRNGNIVALDFGATCFLPVSFFELALCNPGPFTRLLRPLITRPESTQVDALCLASSSLVPFGTNNIGLPDELRKAAT